MDDDSIVNKLNRDLSDALKTLFGATGEGLGQLVKSVEHKLPEQLVQTIWRLAGIRNRVVKSGESLHDPTQFVADCEAALNDLRRHHCEVTSSDQLENDDSEPSETKSEPPMKRLIHDNLPLVIKTFAALIVFFVIWFGGLKAFLLKSPDSPNPKGDITDSPTSDPASIALAEVDELKRLLKLESDTGLEETSEAGKRLAQLKPRYPKTVQNHLEVQRKLDDAAEERLKMQKEIEAAKASFDAALAEYRDSEYGFPSIGDYRLDLVEYLANPSLSDEQRKKYYGALLATKVDGKHWWHAGAEFDWINGAPHEDQIAWGKVLYAWAVAKPMFEAFMKYRTLTGTDPAKLSPGVTYWNEQNELLEPFLNSEPPYPNAISDEWLEAASGKKKTNKPTGD